MKKNIYAIVLVLAIPVGFSYAQKVEPRRLSPEASKLWLDIEQAKHTTENECQKTWGGLQQQQNALAIGAEVPVADREHWVNDKGVIVFVHQEAAKKE
jgi:hypothetical protein